MKKIWITLCIAALLAACKPARHDTLVNIHTRYGDIVVKLYDSTPVHKKNFISLVNSHFYDSTLFHRVIREFMIQGGDPDSKHAKPGQLLGDGDTTYTLPFEYVPSYLHKRGALAAARESDDVNPLKASSGTQFYIVQGKKFTSESLDAVELKVERRAKQYILMDYLKKDGNSNELAAFRKMVEARDTAAIRKVVNKYHDAVEARYMKTKPWKITEAQRNVYTTVGGTPHLDGAYTVFGEVVSGMEIVDKIAAMQTDSNDRPLTDVRMAMWLLPRDKK